MKRFCEFWWNFWVAVIIVALLIGAIGGLIGAIGGWIYILEGSCS